MNAKDFLRNPDRFLRYVMAESGRIAVCEAVDVCTQQIIKDMSPDSISTFAKNNADALGPVLNSLLWQGLPLRKVILRKDWLYIQERAVNILNHMAWMGMFHKGDFGSALGHWEKCLHSLCIEMKSDFEVENITMPDSEDALADHLIGLLVDALDWIKTQGDGFKEDWKGAELRRALTNSRPDVPIPLEDNWAALHKLEDELRATPEHIGTLLTGSFAAENQRDVYSDLDVFAIFEQVPNDALRDDLRDRLQVSNPEPSRTGGFEYFKLGVADIHFMVFERQHIANTFDRFEQDGTQEIMIDLTSDETAWRYSPPAHRWLSGMILSDKDGVLASFRERALYFPPQLRERLVDKWTRVWERYSERFLLAQKEHDHLVSLTALHNCVEASLRVLLANAGIHAEETDVKWLSKEIENLSPEQLPIISEVLEVLPSNLLEPLNTRFKKTQALWEIANRPDSQ